MKNIAVFASGHGTNLQAIIDNIAAGKLKANLALVVSDNPRALAIMRAKRAGIRTFYVAPKVFASKQEYEARVIERLKEEQIELIVLAGFMRILSPFFIRNYRGKIVNIHPALLPSFKGAHAIKDAYLYGVKVTGVTVHFVDEKVDNGPIIAQEPVFVLDGESIEEVEAKVHKVEHRLYAEAIAWVLTGRFRIAGRRVVRR